MLFSRDIGMRAAPRRTTGVYRYPLDTCMFKIVACHVHITAQADALASLDGPDLVKLLKVCLMCW